MKEKMNEGGRQKAKPTYFGSFTLRSQLLTLPLADITKVPLAASAAMTGMLHVQILWPQRSGRGIKRQRSKHLLPCCLSVSQCEPPRRRLKCGNSFQKGPRADGAHTSLWWHTVLKLKIVLFFPPHFWIIHFGVDKTHSDNYETVPNHQKKKKVN